MNTNTKFPYIIEVYRVFGKERALIFTHKFETFLEAYRFKDYWNNISNNHPKNQFAYGPYYE